MISADLVKAERVKQFWDAYRACVEANHIPPQRSGYYVRWVGEFVDFQPETKLRDRSATDIESFLKFLAEQAGAADWQAKQAAYALRLLYEQFLPKYRPDAPDGQSKIAQAKTFRDRILPGEAERRHGPLLQQLRTEVRERHYSYKTETAYLEWFRRFLAFHDYADPRQLAPTTAVRDYLDYLAGVRYVAASTQNQALSALVFLYGQVLHVPVGELGDFQRAKRPRRVPEVMTRGEVQSLLNQLDGTTKLMALLMYGGGLRRNECQQLRVKDVDLERRQIIVREGKGQKDRVTILPEKAVAPTTMIYTHVLNRPGLAPVRSPLDAAP